MDILLLIYLAFRINLLSKRKGAQVRKWIVNLVVGWVFGEIIGAGVGIIIFGIEDKFSWTLIGFGVALTVYFLIFNQLEKLPDIKNDDINNIGNN